MSSSFEAHIKVEAEDQPKKSYHVTFAYVLRHAGLPNTCPKGVHKIIVILKNSYGNRCAYMSAQVDTSARGGQ